jgi:hypothetical protein
MPCLLLTFEQRDSHKREAMRDHQYFFFFYISMLVQTMLLA